MFLPLEDVPSTKNPAPGSQRSQGELILAQILGDVGPSQDSQEGHTIGAVFFRGILPNDLLKTCAWFFVYN